jgi:hypothetical protein
MNVQLTKALCSFLARPLRLGAGSIADATLDTCIAGDAPSPSSGHIVCSSLKRFAVSFFSRRTLPQFG